MNMMHKTAPRLPGNTGVWLALLALLTNVGTLGLGAYTLRRETVTRRRVARLDAIRRRHEAERAEAWAEGMEMIRSLEPDRDRPAARPTLHLVRGDAR